MSGQTAETNTFETNALKPELIVDAACKLGECPLWHPQEQRLYWIDITGGKMFRYDPATSQHELVYEGEVIGGFTLQVDGTLLLFMQKCAVAVWNEGKLKKIIEEIPDERETRFNDVIADPAGRVFCGTMPTKDRPGRLYRLDTNGKLTIVLEGIGCSNGMGFTPDQTEMYYTDSKPREIYLFDYEKTTGALSNQRIFATVPEHEGKPDGMTVDAEGNVCSALWEGSGIVQYSPAGDTLQKISFPAKKVTCVTFGGENYADMYIATAGGQNKNEQGPGAGALFRLSLGIRGVPEFQSKIMI